MDILPTWVWVVLAGVVLVILGRLVTTQRQDSKRPARQGSKRQGYGRKETEQAGSPAKQRQGSKRPARQDSKRPAKRFSKQRQDSWDKRLEENYDVVVIKLSNCGWILVNERDSPDGTKIASFRRQDGLDLLVEKGMAGGMAGGVAGRKLNRGVISYSGTGKKEAEKDLDS